MKSHRWDISTAISFCTVLLFSSATAQYQWVNDPNNPLPIDESVVLEPSVLYNPTNERFDLWYTDGYEIKRAVSADGRTWIGTGASQSLTELFSVSFCYAVEVIRIDSAYYLYGSCQTLDRKTMFIGLATSADGDQWTRHPSSPALLPGGSSSWEKSYVLYPKIVQRNGVYSMYYQGNGKPAEIGLATSADGVHWVKHRGNPIVGIHDIGQNTAAVAPSGVEVVNGTFYMLVNKADNDNNATSNLATSADGVSWLFYQGNPVLSTGTPGMWNAGWLGDGTLRYWQGSFYYWYCAADSRPGQGSLEWQMGLATSEN